MSEPGARPGTAGPRAKRPTMGDVAAHVGVSRQLVGLVFRNQPGASPQTRARVLAAAEELGYHPDAAAQQLRRHRSGLLGVLFIPQNPFDVALVEQLYPAVERHGYSIALGVVAPTHDESRAVEEMLSHRSEALVLIGPELPAEQLERLAARLPVIEVGRPRGAPSVDAVLSDGEQGARLAVEHLVELGHRAIVHVDGGDMPGAVDRRRGYRETMARHGLSGYARVLPGDYSELSGHRAARELLDGPELPTAVAAANDRCAVGVLGTLVRAGVAVPEQVSVTGFDDDSAARLPFVDLTTVRQDPAEIAAYTAEAVAERLERGRTESRQIVTGTHLVVRSSSGPARAR